MAKRWELVIAGELGEQRLELLQQLSEVPAGSAGIIWFDSPGGDSYAGLALASMIRLRRLRAQGIALGDCSSAALLPFAACRKRLAVRECSFLFHPLKWSSEEAATLPEGKDWVSQFERLAHAQDALLAELFAVNLSTIRRWCYPGRHVPATELAKVGILKLAPEIASEIGVRYLR